MGAKFIGLCIFVALLFAGIYTASGNDVGGLHLFFDPPSILIVVLGSLSLSVLAFTPQSWGLGMRLLFGQCPQDGRDQATAFWNGVAVFGLISGTIGTAIGVVILFQNFEDVSKFGPSIAVALISFVYGLVAFAICKAVAYGGKTGLPPSRE